MKRPIYTPTSWLPLCL